MMTRFGSRRMLIVVGLTLAMIVILFSILADIAWQKFQDYDASARQLEPRISRLLGVEQSADILVQADEKISAQLAVLAYPAVKDVETTGAAMQRTLREAMKEAGMTVSGSQILPIKVRDGYDKITLDITATGSMESFAATLKSVAEMTPLVMIETINIKPEKQRRRKGSSGYNVLIKFKALSLRLQP